MGVGVELTRSVPWVFIAHVFAMHAATGVALIVVAAEIRTRDSKAADIVSRIGFFMLASILGAGFGIALGLITT